MNINHFNLYIMKRLYFIFCRNCKLNSPWDSSENANIQVKRLIGLLLQNKVKTFDD